ncbi:MAG TPA: SDR family oxidoreductase [Polyangiaceae bacterium]|jgi:NAD(P)-dependent dehydrogenase (short-subunit alcohol dehydrogenase family)|nr:SDR family oxidoreductase [Polyangiaceae bacterium]
MSRERDLDGRVALITGANTGIGLVTARELAGRGARVFIACRSKERAGPAVESIRRDTGATVEVLPLDLGDLTSVRGAAKAFLDTGAPLHLLINNAGMAGVRGMSKSGFEVTFGVNHVGHFLLTSLLRERLEQSAPGRVVNVSSKAHYDVKGGFPWDSLQKPTRTITAVPEYEVSKLANVLFTVALAKRLADRGINTYALHPGVIASDVWRKVPWPIRPLIKMRMISTEEGAKTTLYCATSPDVAGQTGLYYDECRTKEPSPLARDAELAERLFVESERWTA